MKETSMSVNLRQIMNATSVARHRALSPDRRLRHAVALGAALLTVVASASLGAQSGDGYLLGRPQGSITLRGGYAHANAGSDLFNQVTQDLTLNKSDFSGASFGAELAIPASSNIDVSLDFGYMRTNTPSHYRGFVDTQNQEIQQSTQLTRLPLALNARLYLAPRGRSIGKFAWIPSAVTPWVGGGAGFMWYRFRQDGDFFDTSSLAVFHDTYVSDGWTSMAQAMAGADFTITPRLAITGDARYLWTRRPALSSDFQGFQPLDLSGVALSLGLTVRL
jgi:hypothetical protein